MECVMLEKIDTTYTGSGGGTNCSM